MTITSTDFSKKGCPHCGHKDVEVYRVVREATSILKENTEPTDISTKCSGCEKEYTVAC